LLISNIFDIVYRIIDLPDTLYPVEIGFAAVAQEVTDWGHNDGHFIRNLHESDFLSEAARPEVGTTPEAVTTETGATPKAATPETGITLKTAMPGTGAVP